MRFLTYNLWHGLDGSGRLLFGELEPRGRRLLRGQIQVRSLRAWKPDVLFFQELNPVYPAAYYFSSELQLSHIEQLDLSGVKIFGIGPPFNLQSGLAIMANPIWKLKSLGGVKLSGRWPSSRGPFSLQFEESRYALFGELQHPSWGRVLLVNLHLHHGVEYEPEWTDQIDQCVSEGSISESLGSSIKLDLGRGDRRRLKELSRVFDVLKPIRNRYDLVVLGGDFNSGPRSIVAKKILDLGFRDGWALGGAGDPGLTWDREENRENHLLNDAFRANFEFEVKGIPQSLEQTLLEKVRRSERDARRIDFLYFRTSHSYKLKAELFKGLDPGSKMMGSDHFGIGLELIRA
jgi:endonuclease/exonuclease/phosphatase family metal-dependent hydrolase